MRLLPGLSPTAQRMQKALKKKLKFTDGTNTLYGEIFYWDDIAQTAFGDTAPIQLGTLNRSVSSDNILFSSLIRARLKEEP